MKKKGMLIFTFLMLLCNTLTMYYVNRALKQEINIYVVQVGRYKEKANAENTMMIVIKRRLKKKNIMQFINF